MTEKEQIVINIEEMTIEQAYMIVDTAISQIQGNRQVILAYIKAMSIIKDNLKPVEKND
jgi:hypothetical protein